MAMETQRQLLDQLMGKERNLVEDQKTNKKRTFTDPDVDIYYLCGCSPHELFYNTNSDLGPNPLVPDDKLKEEWEALPQSEKDKYGFEYQLMKYLEKVVEKCDRRIARNMQRAEIDAKMSQSDSARIEEIETQIRTLTEEAITVADSDPEKSEKLNADIEALNEAKNQVIEKHKNKKHLIVCKVSGNLLSNDDTEERLKAHYGGKQYQGWTLVRKKLKELQESRPPPPSMSHSRDLQSYHGGNDAGQESRYGATHQHYDRGSSRHRNRYNNYHSGDNQHRVDQYGRHRASIPRERRRRSQRSLSRSRSARQRGRVEQGPASNVLDTTSSTNAQSIHRRPRSASRRRRHRRREKRSSRSRGRHARRGSSDSMPRRWKRRSRSRS